MPALRGQRERLDGELLDRVGQVAGAGPAGRHGRDYQLLGFRGHPAVQQPPRHRRLLLRRLGRIRQRAPQAVLGVEQPDDREQLVPDPVGAVGGRDRGQPLPQPGVGSPAGAAHYCPAPVGVVACPAASPAPRAPTAAPPSPESSSLRKRSTIRVCRATSVSDSPTMRLASSVASAPTSLRSEVSACCRSASIWDCAASVIRRASASARSRISAMIAAPCSLASSRIRAASCLASSSCARYCWSTACASACASSARLIPPSIWSWRSSSVFIIRGRPILARKPNTKTKRIVPMMNSGHEGSSGLYDAVSAASGIMVRSLPGRGSGVLEDERGHEADQGERLGEREADPHVQRDAY